jgi:hypothetical protein
MVFSPASTKEETSMSQTLQEKITAINDRLRSYGIEAVQEIKMTEPVAKRNSISSKWSMHQITL